MQVNLEPTEASLLLSILDSSLGDLRMEIGKTENFDMRNELKDREAILKTILVRVRNATAVA
ncbi:hypothetical protein J0H33_12990 [bacterium]|jgi:hypothetical protein|nr:hypothetical protein [bacterium]